MKWPTYPKYKDSGVDWLGEVPEEWEVVPLKRQASLRTEKAEQRLSYSIALENIESWTGKYIETDSEFESNGTLFFIGDILFGKLRPYLAKVFLAPEDGEAVGDFHVIASKKSLKSEFLQCQLLTRGMIDIIDGSTFGAKMPRASWEFIGSLPIAVPSIPEQKSINAFLSQKLAKIDDLIAEQEKLISLLQEKRQAVISHAVTKGLNPDAPMKDSGVEWLGEIPRTWQIKALRHLFNNQDYKRIPLSSEERGKLEKIYPYYGASGIIDYVDRFIFDEPLILVAEDGANLLSRSTPLAFLASGKCWVNNHAHIIKPVIGDIQYWVMLLQSYDYTSLITGAAQPKLTAERLSAIVLPCPPPDEQRTIAVYTIQENEKINSLIAEAENGVELLKERRTALISAAVTGKIDVRGLTASEPA